MGGKIPAKEDIQRILDKALTEDDSRNDQFYSRSKQSSQKRKHENPARSSLERRGIEFPSSTPVNGSTSSFDANNENKCSQLLYTAPCSEQEESEQLAIIMLNSKLW